MLQTRSLPSTHPVKHANWTTFPSLAQTSDIFKDHRILWLMLSLASKLTYLFLPPQCLCGNLRSNNKQMLSYSLTCSLQTLSNWSLKRPMVFPLPVTYPLVLLDLSYLLRYDIVSFLLYTISHILVFEPLKS